MTVTEEDDLTNDDAGSGMTNTPTPEQLAEAHDRASKLGLTIRGRKNYRLHSDTDSSECVECGDFNGLLWHLSHRETVERGEPTCMMWPCGSAGTVFMNNREETSYHVEWAEDGKIEIDGEKYKKTCGHKTELKTGETIQFDVLEDGSHKETRRFPKQDDEDDEAPTPAVLTLVRRIKALIEKADRAADKAEQLYKAAGIHIKEIKEQCEDWETIVREQCGLGRSRAYELMAIADGKMTLEKVRAETNERKKVHRAKSESVPERTEPEPKPEPLPSPQPEPVGHRATASVEESAEERRAYYEATENEPIAAPKSSTKSKHDLKRELENFQSGVLSRAYSAVDDANYFRKVFQKHSRAVTGEIVEAVSHAADAWSKLASELGSKLNETRH